MSKYILVILLSWFIAHLIKFIIICINNHEIKLSFDILDSGGMPSAHTAVMSSIVMSIGFVDGFETGLFALALVMLAIVMHDAMRVRKSCGDQGLALNQIIKKQKYSLNNLKISKGHTPQEVFVGLVIGIVISAIVFLAT